MSGILLVTDTGAFVVTDHGARIIVGVIEPGYATGVLSAPGATLGFGRVWSAESTIAASGCTITFLEEL